MYINYQLTCVNRCIQKTLHIGTCFCKHCVKGCGEVKFGVMCVCVNEGGLIFVRVMRKKQEHGASYFDHDHDVYIRLTLLQVPFI